ncbi:MFS transporter [Streptomyces sp. NPDC096094]|uniref:MFS transporter n=1 Tax=Streptomyces sp. NPDC096094 TaxID=3366073 RepID=UPI00382D07BD
MTGMLAGNSQAQVAQHFRTTDIAWFTLIGALVGTFVVPFGVKAASLWGKKRVIIILTLTGLVGDVIAAAATSFSMLLAGRAIAGVYVAAAPIAYSLARDVFPRKIVGTASGLLGGSVGIVALVGPFLSGWLIDNHGFRGALWFMAVATLIGLVLTGLFVPESPVRETGRMNWLSGLLLGGGITSVVYAIGEGTHWGWTSGKFFTFIGAGAVLLLLFAAAERKTEAPFFPGALVRRREVWTVLLATAIAGGCIYAVGTVVQILSLMPAIPGVSDGMGWSATKVALITSPMSLILIATAIGAGSLARRIDLRYLLASGAAIAAVGYGLLSQFHGSVTEFVICGSIAGIGMGLVVSTIPVMIIAAVRPEEQALGNGAQNVMQGVTQVLFTQVAFVVMAQSGVVLKGTQFYRDSGFTNGILIVVGFLVLAAVLTALIPRLKRLDQVETGHAA